MAAISVIIPLYNKGKYIERTLKSVLAQTFTDYEIIIVNDGSTDNGPSIVKKYVSNKIRLITQSNSGSGAARNRGINESSSEFVAFLDADDEWAPNYLHKVISIRKQHPDIEIIASNWIADFSTHPNGLRNVNMSDYMQKMYGIRFSSRWKMSKNIKTAELMQIAYRFFTSGISCTKKVALKYKGFGTESNYGEDWLLWLQFIFNETIYFIDEPLVTYHDEFSGVWCGGAQNHGLELWFVKYDSIWQNCPDEHRFLLKKWFVYRALYSAHVRLGLGKFSDVEYLLKHFPLMQPYTFLSYLKLRAKQFFYNFKKFKS